jgi:AcrR family transcriptional regulator
LEKLSIRKIANKIEYSPTIIYYYFRDKNDILSYLFKEKYKIITSSLSKVQTSYSNPIQRLEEMSRTYIKLALEMPDEYKAIMLNNSLVTLEQTSVLIEGASAKRQAIKGICKCLKEIFSDANDIEIELTAQVLWGAIFGLIIRLITEREVLSIVIY